MLVKELVKKIEPELIEVRRYLHRNPELGNEEHLTMDKIIECLKAWNIEYEKKKTGIVAIVRGGQEGKTIGLRADIDALPIEEKAEVPFKSENEGVMHACGHDVHTTILLGAGFVLQNMKEEFKGNVKLFFQPAEETTGGAERMILEGCLENPKVENVLGLHVTPDVDTGKIEIKAGKLFAASDMLTIRVEGFSAHGASPHDGIDPVVASGAILQSLQPLISRKISPFDSAVLTVGSIHGGTGGNIIADSVEMRGILRTLDPETRKAMQDRMEAAVVKTGEAYGVKAVLEVEHSYCPLINDEEITGIVEKTSREMLGEDNVIAKKHPTLKVEDFAYFAEKLPSCFYEIGCRNEELDCTEPLHNGRFKVDEDCIAIGTELQVRNTLALLNE